MKTLYLLDENYNWKQFEYENLSDLSEEFLKRRISIGNGCKLGNGCELGNECELGYGCKLGNECKLGNGCKLGYECDVPFAIYIKGSVHFVSWWQKNIIKIGCYSLEINEWLEKFEAIGKKENYSESQIKEYKLYIDLISEMQKSLIK